MLSLTGIDHGPIQTAMLSYFVDEAHSGRGLATHAVADALQHAFGELGLHRVEAAPRLRTSHRSGCSSTTGSRSSGHCAAIS